MPFQVLLYYLFVPIEDVELFADEHRSLCERLGLKGRIIIATEGINGTVSGSTESCAAYMEAVRADPRFKDIEFKIDDAPEIAFKKLFVRVRPEIITLGLPLDRPVHEETGPRLTPAEWRAMMEREDVVIVDGRNDYESELGHFRGAICPPVESFRELPAWFLENRDKLAGKTMLTYCTGGIRCEKLTAWLRQEGFGDVYQLHGGIVMYGKDPETQGELFEGVNVVFDDRVVVSAGERSTLITHCRECGELSANYVNCANVLCNKRIILCPACEVHTERCCSDECRNSDTRREKGKKLYESKGRS